VNGNKISEEKLVAPTLLGLKGEWNTRVKSGSN